MQVVVSKAAKTRLQRVEVYKLYVKRGIWQMFSNVWNWKQQIDDWKHMCAVNIKIMCIDRRNVK